jgi:regulator of replication initiation timing
VTNDNRETWSGYHAGVSLVKKAKDLNFDLDLMYGNEDGLINQIAAISLTKSFGKAKAKTVALEKTPDFPKIDESLTTQDYDKDFKELETLKKLNKKLKAENTALKAQNEKLKLLAEKKIQQEKAKEKLIVGLLKENEKLKLTNQIFKNKILDNENEALLRSIEEEAKKSESNKLAMLYFLAIYITTVLLLTSLIASLYNKIRYGFSRQELIS